MKKLLVLMLILGITSAASAALIELQLDGISGTNSFDLKVVVTGTGVYDSYSFSISTNAGTMYDNAGSTSAVAGGIGYFYSGIVSNAIAEMKDFNMVSSWPVGTVVWDFGVTTTTMATVTLAAGGDLTRVNGGYVTPADTIVIPEPMTIALLGLGGLFLRRRK